MVTNKAGLLNFLCETRSKEEQLAPTIGLSRLYLGGGSNEESWSVLITQGSWISEKCSRAMYTANFDSSDSSDSNSDN